MEREGQDMERDDEMGGGQEGGTQGGGQDGGGEEDGQEREGQEGGQEREGQEGGTQAQGSGRRLATTNRQAEARRGSPWRPRLHPLPAPHFK